MGLSEADAEALAKRLMELVEAGNPIAILYVAWLVME